jgi:hypothetical protein
VRSGRAWKHQQGRDQSNEDELRSAFAQLFLTGERSLSPALNAGLARLCTRVVFPPWCSRRGRFAVPSPENQSA